jgi:hypothetical protein
MTSLAVALQFRMKLMNSADSMEQLRLKYQIWNFCYDYDELWESLGKFT